MLVGHCKDNHAMLGAELALAVETEVRNSFTMSKVNSFKAVGEYYDLQDLQAKLKDKPEQLAFCLANAKTIVCPSRGCIMYELLTHTSESDERQTATQDRPALFEG